MLEQIQRGYVQENRLELRRLNRDICVAFLAKDNARLKELQDRRTELLEHVSVKLDMAPRGPGWERLLDDAA